MNTSKQVSVMVGLLMVFALGTLLYFLWDPTRADEASDRQLTANVERAAKLFALNCRVCHGMTGTGALERPGLPGLPLNDPSQRPTAIGDLNNKQTRFTDTIKCGRVGTLMPPWSSAEGGSLNDFQIQQLVLLITSQKATVGWEAAVADANTTDAFVPPEYLAAAAAAADTTLKVNSVNGIKAKDLLRVDDNPTDAIYELVTVSSVDTSANTITVVRGAAGSKAADHVAGAEVFHGPILPPSGPLTGESGTPPCGQKNVSVTPTPGPSGSPAPGATTAAGIAVSGSMTIEMGDNFFTLNGQKNPTITVKAGDTINVTAKNTGTAIHNLHVANPSNQYSSPGDSVLNPQALPGGQQGTLSFTFAKAGTYNYQCDFHPADMKGQIVVQ